MSTSSSPVAWRRSRHTANDATDDADEMSDSSASSSAPLTAMLLEVVSSGSNLLLYAVTSRGDTVRCEVTQYYPSIYVRVLISEAGARREITEADLVDFRTVLEAELQSSRAAKTLKKNAPPQPTTTARASSPSAKKGGKNAPASGGNNKKGGTASAASSFFGKKPEAAAAASSSKVHDEEEDDDDVLIHDEAGDDFAGDDDAEEDDDETDHALSGSCIVHLRLIQKRSLMYYRGDVNESFVQVFLRNPTLCTPAHQILTKPKLSGLKSTAAASSSSSSASTASTVVPPSTKTCEVCTLVNSSSATVCSACDTALPAAAPSSPSIAASSSPLAYLFTGDCYGSNTEHYLRFMVDADLRGGGWMEFIKYERVEDDTRDSTTNCRYDLRVKWNQFASSSASSSSSFFSDLPLRGLSNDVNVNPLSATIAPMRAISFDIQVSTRADNITPDAKVDPIVSIANTVWWFGSDEDEKLPNPEEEEKKGDTREVQQHKLPIQVLFIVRTCTSKEMPSLLTHHPSGYTVIYCTSESDLLLKWRNFFLEIDPDIITGYDIAEKDLPYILERVEKYAKSGESGNGSLTQSPNKRRKTAPSSPSTSSSYSSSSTSFANWTHLGRDSRIPSTLQGIQTYTAGWVKSKRRMTTTSNEASAYFRCEGRLFFDCKRIIQTTHSLRTYSLQESCEEFLKRTEEYLDDTVIALLLLQSRAKSRTGDHPHNPALLANTVPLPEPTRTAKSFLAKNNTSAAAAAAAVSSTSAASSSNANSNSKKKMTAASRKRHHEAVGYEPDTSPSSTSSAAAASSNKLTSSSASSLASGPAIVASSAVISSNVFNSPLQAFQRYCAYCIRQSELPLLLMHDLMILVASMELARTTGINIRDVWTRGQMIRTWSLLLRHCHTSDYLIPSQRDNSQAQTMTSAPYLFDCLGGGNGKNTTGLYNDPVATLDFASLYPSIMIAYNLSYDTIIVREDEDKILSNNDTILTPINRRFVKPSIRKGVIPLILEYLLDARKKVKKLMNELPSGTNEKSMLRSILNERQKALKISANAAYGFTGSSASKLLLVELAESTINYGSRLLQQSAQWVEERFGGQCEVIYGDTDSLMILMKGKTVEQAMQLAHQVSKSITESHQKPITFAYEKIYCPFLLQQNKKYAGVKYTSNSNKHDELDVKGIESVRRDIILLVREMIHRLLELILVEKNLPEAIRYTKQVIWNLLNDQYSLYDLITTKALWRGVDSTQYGMKLAHIEYAEKLRKRYPNRSIVLGQRVSYVFVQGSKGVKQWEQTEEPAYVEAHSIPIDYDLYLANYIQKPVVRLFGLKGLLNTPEKATKTLFTGDHVLHVKKAAPAATGTKGGLGNFFKKEVGTRCSQCKRPMDEPPTNGNKNNTPAAASSSASAATTGQKKLMFGASPKKPGATPPASASSSSASSKPAGASSSTSSPTHGLCSTCISQLDRVMVSRTLEYAERESHLASLAQQCHRCQGGGCGGLHLQPILCVNEDCEVYWKRRKVWRGVQHLHEALRQLEW